MPYWHSLSLLFLRYYTYPMYTNAAIREVLRMPGGDVDRCGECWWSAEKWGLSRPVTSGRCPLHQCPSSTVRTVRSDRPTLAIDLQSRPVTTGHCHIQCHAALSEESSGGVTPFDGGRKDVLKERAPATVVQHATVSPPLMQSTCVGLRRAGTDRSDVIAG